MAVARPRVEDEWEVVKDLGEVVEIDPITSTDVTKVGLPLFIVAHASGRVKLYVCDSGKLVCEIGAHSR